MVGRQKEKFERLYLTYLDKLSIADTMRRNLASDIIAGYHLSNVVKQMVQIEDYESTVVSKARNEYENYKSKFTNEDIRNVEHGIHKLIQL